MALSDVYVVDDHPMFCYGLRAFLGSAGHRVVGDTGDPGKALAEVAQLAPTVLLLDLQLGIDSGVDLLGMIQLRRLRTQTIAMTASADPRDMAAALRLGASGHIQKTAEGADFLRAIATVLTREKFLGASVSVPAESPLNVLDSTRIIASLSARERETIEMVVNGFSSAEIAASLGLSPKTVDSYRSRLMAKVGAGNVPALVRFAIRAGLLDARLP